MNESSKLVRFLGVISVATVAIVAAVVSYAHMQAVAEHAGEGWRSWLEPFSVDGLLIGASLVVYVRRRSPLAWLAIAVGLSVSLAANLAAAEPTLISRLVSAWPAIALALSYETLLTLFRHPATSTPSEKDNHTPNSTQGTKESGHEGPEFLQPEFLQHEQEQKQEQPAPVNGRIFADTSTWADLVKEGN
jgi:hypothetical protein